MPVSTPTGVSFAVSNMFFDPVSSAVVDTAGNPMAIAPYQLLQTSSPTTGQTVVMADTGVDGTLVLTPAAGLATLTITLPSDANSRLLQKRSIYCSKSVVALTINGATILNSLIAMTANDHHTFQKVAANTWVLCL